ncbi:hypothetical protein [Pseudomonas sp. RIT-PI-q]|uniref:hypothetical protein n=1 Tax=Pseudomonas sp. RIT-PI-q TaxID=1690247 RepID=UPI00128ED42A|nr:hypothetical protein [Pseudomonas sp. RIT-PI-q]
MTRFNRINVVHPNPSLASQLLPSTAFAQTTRSTVGAGSPAKDVNDDGFQQDKRGAFECFAGKPAPTGDCGFQLLILPLPWLLILICSPYPKTP